MAPPGDNAEMLSVEAPQGLLQHLGHDPHHLWGIDGGAQDFP